MMVDENQDPHRTAYTVTVDYRNGTCNDLCLEPMHFSYI